MMAPFPKGAPPPAPEDMPPADMPPESADAEPAPASDPDQLIASIEQQLNQLRAALAGLG